MKKTWHSLKNRVTAMLLALICVLGLLPTAVLAAGADTIKLERFGMSGVSYQSASLGRCTMHQMYYGVAGKTSVGFCGTKGGGMGTSLIGQTWGDPKPVTDPTVKMMMAYYYAHSLGIFTDKAHALGVDDIWDSGYSWYMNAWVRQADRPRLRPCGSGYCQWRRHCDRNGQRPEAPESDHPEAG